MRNLSATVEILPEDFSQGLIITYGRYGASHGVCVFNGVGG